MLRRGKRMFPPNVWMFILEFFKKFSTGKFGIECIINLAISGLSRLPDGNKENIKEIFESHLKISGP